jgi:hypothetical protein
MVTPRELGQNLARARRFQPLSPAELTRVRQTGLQLARQ